MRSVSYAGYTGTPLTVEIRPDDMSGIDSVSWNVPPTTTYYNRTLTAHVSGGSGGPYKIVWYRKTCTIMFSPTRNACDSGPVPDGTGPSITAHFGRYDWKSEYSVQVEDSTLTGTEGGLGVIVFEGPGDPYEGGSSEMSCYSNEFALYHSTTISTDLTPETGWFRFNICDGSLEKAP